MIPVAVSQRVDVLQDGNETRDALDQRFCDWLAAVGLLAFPVPNRPALIAEWLAHVQPKGIVLSGGNDVGACADRDTTECHLLEYAKTRRLPVLGICHGMQVLVTYSGGSLQKVAGHISTRHQLSGTLTGEVNSYHQWGVLSLPEDYVALARGPDDSIEAMRHVAMPWEGWMWHPEREISFLPAHISRVRTLFQNSEL
jgi:putative glutamine amidotransferase